MKLNNKGFAITAMIYVLMLIFLLMITSLLTALIDRNRKTDLLLNGIYESVKYTTTIVSYDEVKDVFSIDGTKVGKDGAFVTPKRAKYEFRAYGKVYKVYLPKNVIILSNKARKVLTKELFYKFASGESDDLELSNYTSLEDIKIK